MAVIRPLIGSRYQVGHEVIDTDHKIIADGWFRAVNCEPIQFPFLIGRLKKLMKTHFEHETALMQMAGGMLCDCHRTEHQTLLDLCERAAVLSNTNWQRTQSVLRHQFPKLVRSHIACMDQVAVLFINTQARAAQKLDGRD